ncbi:hypothetical protein TTHERM_000985227 (macronuclear) [Tetrahymena thermophila SB210]|uniref:Uncharacterized protein n=1 Tax=Tetrahymena thermophila (strain SB210) TaxID=312017 RepID=W7XD64_TETTS|nr:hypothetical protein TTHERM_000985227 [Tetrahymena thermophila SB210]EWS75437.1 hypothetical protein TTHERM_000985227 [Tetrahymena thermophila SB210]|eukprot:XP_012652022.1 hypothetical protein TTHERM_000985227 [Tetrahymena thermophila SB210]
MVNGYINPKENNKCQLVQHFQRKSFNIQELFPIDLHMQRDMSILTRDEQQKNIYLDNRTSPVTIIIQTNYIINRLNQSQEITQSLQIQSKLVQVTQAGSPPNLNKLPNISGIQLITFIEDENIWKQ